MVLVACSYIPPFFHSSASNTRKLPNGMLEAMTSKVVCSKPCSPMVSNAAVRVSVFSWSRESNHPRNEIFLNGIVIRAGHGYGQKTAYTCTRFEK